MDVGSPWPRRRRSSLTTTAPLLRKPPCKAWVDRTGCSCIPSSYFSCFLLLFYSTYTAMTPPSPPPPQSLPLRRRRSTAPRAAAVAAVVAAAVAAVVVSLDRPKMESSSRKPSCPSFSFNCTKTRRGKSILQLAACSFF